MKLNAWAISDIGLTRKSNQDSVGSFPDLNLFIVADGMGGHANGEVASRMAVDTIHGFFVDSTKTPVRPSDLECLKRAVELANHRIHDEGLRSTHVHGRSPGTTVVVLKVDLQAGRASWVHVGDSRLYRMRNARLALLTADHTLFGNEYLNKRPIPTDLPHTNQLVQALGTHDSVDVTAATEEIIDGDLFVLCSDGISGQLTASVLEATLDSANNLDATASTLIRLSLDAGGRDNASLVLIRVVAD